jgi:hypothetical protein
MLTAASVGLCIATATRRCRNDNPRQDPELHSVMIYEQRVPVKQPPASERRYSQHRSAVERSRCAKWVDRLRRRMHAIGITAVVWSGGWLIALIAALSHDAGGNHWWLFGTWVDRLVVQHGHLLALAASAPLMAPFALQRTKGHAVLAFIGALHFLVMYTLLTVAAD